MNTNSPKDNKEKVNTKSPKDLKYDDKQPVIGENRAFEDI